MPTPARSAARPVQIRLAAEAATLAIAGILVATALLPSMGGAERGGLLTTLFALLAFDALWFHALPPRFLRRDRFIAGAAVAQLIAAWLIASTGGISSPYFTFFLLPILATVFDLGPRRTLQIGAVAAVAFIVVALGVRPPAGVGSEARDLVIIRGLALAGFILLCALIARTLGSTRRQLVDEEARRRALIAALRDPFLTTTPDGTITGFNAAAATFFGGRERLDGRSVREVLPFAAAPADWRSGDTVQGRISGPSDREADVEVSQAPLGGRASGLGAVYVIHDVSEHVALSRLREQLLYDVAHELRAPLAVLDNALELLLTDYASLPTNEFVELIGTARRTSGRLHGLMNDLLSAGSIQSGRFVVHPVPQRLETLIDAAVETIRPARRTSTHPIEIDVPDVTVLADREHAAHVLTNLLSNAVKYSPDGEPIRVSASIAGPMVRVAVEDRGRGIPAAEQGRLFERFYRVRGTGQEPGIGLGLAIAKGIVEAHGGTIGVDSEPGRGTTVWFTLPAAPAEAA